MYIDIYTLQQLRALNVPDFVFFCARLIFLSHGIINLIGAIISNSDRTMAQFISEMWQQDK